MRGDKSAERSREDNRQRDDSKGRQAPFYRESLYRSSSSVRSQFKASQGPMLFKGSENSSVLKNAQPQFEEDADGFKKPPPRSEKMEEERKRCKQLNEYGISLSIHNQKNKDLGMSASSLMLIWKKNMLILLNKITKNWAGNALNILEGSL